MPYEAKPGTAAVFTNRNKQNDRQPDYKGTITIRVADGDLVCVADMEIAIWDKIDKNGHPYRFVSIQEPYGQRTAQQRPLPVAQPTSDTPPPDDEDVRF